MHSTIYSFDAPCPTLLMWLQLRLRQLTALYSASATISKDMASSAVSVASSSALPQQFQVDGQVNSSKMCQGAASCARQAALLCQAAWHQVQQLLLRRPVAELHAVIFKPPAVSDSRTSQGICCPAVQRAQELGSLSNPCGQGKPQSFIMATQKPMPPEPAARTEAVMHMG